MIDALYNGISGLNGFQTALNSESNNISNVNTVGYKSDKISFADQVYQASIGRGVKMDTMDKNFSQGNLKITNNDYDLAIEGKGFFIVQGDTKELFYTRSGDFRVANDGTLQLPSGYKVQGISATTAATVSSSDDKLFSSDYSEFLAAQTVQSTTGEIVETINAKSTDYKSSAMNDEYSKHGDGYKTREAKIIDIDALTIAYQNELKAYTKNQVPGTAATKQVTNINFDTTQLNNSLDSIEITIGNITYNQSFQEDATTTLKALADKISNEKLLTASVGTDGTLQITDMLPGDSVSIGNAYILNGATVIKPLPTIETTPAESGSGKARVESIENELKAAIENADGKYLRISSVIDTTDIQNKTIGDLQMQLDTLQLSESPFGTTEIVDGVIYVNQDDNRFAIGKVSTAVFTNELGLNPQGDNLYAATAQSGTFTFGTNENRVLSKTLELSNSELSESLVNLMVYQRAFEASSKAVTTSDEFLKTAIALKK